MARLTHALDRFRRDVATRCAQIARADRERGDVPGWVFLTIMTAGIVMAIWAFAGDELVAMVTDAFASVTAP